MGAYLRKGLFNYEKTMVSFLRKEIEYKMGKLEYKKVGSHVAEDQQHLLIVVIDLYSLSFISEEELGGERRAY